MNKKTYIGIDVGGTKIEAALFDSKLKVLNSLKIKTNQKGFGEVKKDILRLIMELSNENTKAVGIGLPGYLNPKSGIVYKLPNIKISKPINIKKYFEKHSKIKTFIDNDANLFTLAEHNNEKTLLGLTIGTGLGGGIIINKQVHRGKDGFAGEFGHVSEGSGEWEDLLSGKTNNRYLAKNLAKILCNLIHIFNPERIVLGGTVAKKHFKNIEKEVIKSIGKNCPKESLKKLKIDLSKYENAGLRGAALLAINNS